ncbi:uncharacterized protein TNCV_2806281 [Trichonephila clavipes]|nr:uncharacterized protein TNCV_2806281 [Trichonephila clavipes]
MTLTSLLLYRYVLTKVLTLTKSARLAVFARYCVGNIIKEALIAKTSLLTTTKGTDICTAFDKLNLSQFDWLEIEELEMQLIDFQSSSIWIQRFTESRKKLELFEAERLTSNIIKNVSNEILETWNSIPDAFNCLKKLAYAILTIFSSTYACESLFSEITSKTRLETV